MTDALRDKAGIKDLNGLVSLEQFDAVRGDLEKRIASAYDKFNNQEIIWQVGILPASYLLSFTNNINAKITLFISLSRLKYWTDIYVTWYRDR